MNVTRSKLVQVMAVSFVVIGLLVAAWPGVAQGELPQSKSPHNRYEEMRQLARQTNAAGSSTQSVSFPSAVSWASAYIQQEEYAGLGRGLSAAFDHNGRLHAAYSGTNDGILRYAHFKGSAWQIETVDSNTGDDTTLILDSTDRPNLLYTAGGNIKYAKFDGISWSIKTVISNTVQASLGLDSSDRPYISYYDESTADLKITYLAGESWHTELVDTSGDVGRYNRLRIDKPGQVHIAYCVYDPASTSCTKLKYASKVGTTWQTQIVDVGPSVGSGISLALDDGDHPHISYLSTAGGSGFDTALLYASHIGSSWQLRPVEYYQRDSLWTSIEVDRAGVPHISAAGLSGGAGQVFYAARTTGVWQVERPSDFYGGHHPVQLIDNRNQSVVVYYIYWGVLYATRTPDATDTYQLTYGSYRDNNWEVYSAQANGSTPVRRTYNPAYDSTPKFRRGANQIAFISNRDGNSEVYVMNADGTGVLRLTNTPANEYMPVWSPDGTKIAFYSYRDGNSEIYVMNANGSSQTRLTNNLSWDGHPDWSPNSQQIVFASNRDGSDELWIMNADGTNQHQVTFGLNAVYPSWSPDGNRIAFNDDTNNDGWLDIALINTNGTGLAHPLSYSPVNYDLAAPTWSPDGLNLAFARIQWILYQGQYYWVDAYLNSMVVANSGVYPLTSSGLDWWPQWQTTDINAPVSGITHLSEWNDQTTFIVSWFAYDVGTAGVSTFDIQYRDGANGIWINWFNATNQTSAVFTGQHGHTYYFRSRARDYANNLEAYPSSPDAMTTIYQHTATGQVYDNRDQPVAVVNMQVNPTALNTGISRHDGLYDLYFASGGTYTLTTTRINFGQLPALLNVTVPSSNSLPTLYLLPLDNQLSDSHFESGNPSAWNASGDLTPTITSTAHTGNYAALLGRSVPTDTITIGPWHSAIEQTINISPTIVSGTLSLLYRVDAVEPLSDTLNAYLVGANNALTFTLPVTTSGWTHVWFDVAVWTEPTATLKIDFAIGDVDREARIILDEITWGSAITGSHAIFLPLVRR